jgi:hypothetical protein
MCWYSCVKFYFCFTLGVDFLFEWFYFPLYPTDEILFSTIGFIFHYGTFHFVFHQGLSLVLFSTMAIFPPCFTLWVNPPCFTLWVGRADLFPLRVRHGMATLRPTKVKDGIFKPVVKRYIFLSGVTWLKI